jgi:hypothetical protein
MIDGQVVRDLEKPARKFEFRAVTIEVVENLDEGFLREVLGGFAVPDHAKNQGKNRPLVSREQLTVCGFRSLPRLNDDIGVG